MSGIESPQGLEQQIDPIEATLAKIEEQFGDLGYEDFIEGFEELDGEKQAQVIEIFANQKDNPNFEDYVFDEWPIVHYPGVIGDFITKFQKQDKIDISRKLESDSDSIKERKLTKDIVNDKEDQLNNSKDLFKTQLLEDLWKEFNKKSDIYSDIIGSNIDDSVDGRINFLESNYLQLLGAAKDYSRTEEVRLYERLSELKKAGILELPEFENYEIGISKRSLERDSKITRGDEPGIEAALGESRVDRIDGDIIYGANGEVIDASGRSLQLSLEGEDGMILEVGEVEKLDTRSQEVQISKLNKEKENNEKKIGANEKSIQSLQKAQEEFSGIPDDAYESENFREQIAKKFSSQSPKGDAMKIFRAAENSSGIELKNMVLSFLSNKVIELSNNNTELSQRNSEIKFQVAQIANSIDTQRRIAAEKVYNKKEKVRQSQQFLEGLGVSRVIANASEIFAMIQPENPISLPNGDIITGVNFATMTFEGSFTPSLGDDGVNDIRTQEVLTQLMNKALSNSFSGPIELTGNGNIVYKLDGKIQDKAVFEAFVNELTGTGNMEMKIQDNLFDSEMIQDEKSMITPE